MPSYLGALSTVLSNVFPSLGKFPQSHVLTSVQLNAGGRPLAGHRGPVYVQLILVQYPVLGTGFPSLLLRVLTGVTVGLNFVSFVSHSSSFPHV